MGIVIVDISISVDGYIAGRNLSEEQPMGENGLRLHNWFFNPVNAYDEKIMPKISESTGAVIIGRRMFDLAIDKAWSGDNPFNAHVYVVTSKAPPEKRVAGFTFVNDGIESALAQARSEAGNGNVWVAGGANIIQQYIGANLVDELRLHTVPLLLSDGTRLFEPDDAPCVELKKLEVVESPAVIHSRYRIIRQG